MNRIQLQFVGVELYFDNLEKAKDFYRQMLGLTFPMNKADITPSSTVV